MNNKDKPYISWDTATILEAQAKYLVETGEAEHEEQGWTMASEDQFLLDDEWNGLLFDLTEKLREIDPQGYWHCKVNNFGWRKTSGYKNFQAQTGQEFLSKILPKTDCSFHIYIDDNVIKIQNFHHDSPTGNEWYTIVARECHEVAAIKTNNCAMYS